MTSIEISPRRRVDVARDLQRSAFAGSVACVLERFPATALTMWQPAQVVLHIPEVGTVLMLDGEAGADALSFPALRQFMRQHQGAPLTLVLVDGSPDTRRQLQNAKPFFTYASVSLVHLVQGAVRFTQGKNRLQDAFADAKPLPLPSAERWQTLVEQAASNHRSRVQEAQEVGQFVDGLRQRKAWATRTLVAVLLSTFGLEWYFGGVDSGPVLLHMGALSPQKVAEGEVWRLVSCTFLHAGPMHLAFNAYVLYAIGSQLERLLGTPRFFVLYALSCLGGSALSYATLGDKFSVGASGGLWGLMTAFGVLAWQKDGILPAAMAEAAKKAAVTNLVLNLLNSLQSHVDVGAHVGGGLVGAALVFTGVLTHQLPRARARQDREGEGRMGAPAHRGFTASALAMALLFVVAGGLAFVQGAPWRLREPVALASRTLADLGFALDLPTGLPTTRDPYPSTSHDVLRVGDLLSDPGAVELEVFPIQRDDPAQLEIEKNALLDALRTPPENASLVDGPRVVTLDHDVGIRVTRRYPNHVEELVAFRFLDNLMLKVTVLRFPELREAVPDDYIERIIGSLATLPTP